MTERLNHLMLKHNVQAQNELPQEETKLKLRRHKVGMLGNK